MKRNKIPGVLMIEGHVQGLSITRAMGAAGIPVIVIDRYNCIARYSKYCNKFFYCPEYLSEEFVPFIISLSIKENLSGWTLLPSNDHALVSISKNRSELQKYFKIITPGLDIIEKIYDKSNLLDVAGKCNVHIPLTYYFKTVNDSLPDHIHFPLIIKGRNGLTFYKSVGRKVLLSDSEDSLRRNLKQVAKNYSIQNTLIQELIPFDGTNNTLSFTAFCIHGEIKAFWIGEKIREHPIRFGTATFARSIDCEPLIEPSKKLVKELDYSGVCEIEYLYDPRDGQYKLIEINARTWLWIGLARACGVDYAILIYNYLNGIPNNYPNGYIKGLNWVNFITDIPYSVIAILRRKLSPGRFFSSFKGKTVDAFFSWGDIKPGIMFFILLFYIIFRRR